MYSTHCKCFVHPVSLERKKGINSNFITKESEEYAVELELQKWRHGGFMVSVLSARWSCLGSSPGHEIVLCSQARHCTRRVPLSAQEESRYQQI